MNEGAAVLGPCPRLVIAMAEHRLGDEPKARTTLAEEISAHDWSLAQVRSHDQWLWHVLRREAEGLIFPNIPAFLEGEYQPRDNTERLASLGVCRFKNQTCTSARLYADAFAADPALANETGFGYRYKAACAAALAGAGVGDDAGKLNETERAVFRKQAYGWLADELASVDKQLQGASEESRDHLLRFLKQWQTDTDLAGLR